MAIDLHERKSDTGPDGKCKVKYETVTRYFDVEAKIWKPLTSVAQLMNTTRSCFCAEYIGNYLYVAAKKQSGHFVIYRYHIANSSWETLPSFLESNHKINCLCVVHDYIYAISESNPPQRYSLANNNWQKGAKSNFESDCWNRFCTIAAVVWISEIYVIHGKRKLEGSGKNTYWVSQPAVVHCFDPAKNKWEQKSSTCYPHFGSSLFVVNSRLYVAGGKKSYSSDEPYGDSAAVEVYNEEINFWSVVEQKHIPPNKLGAVEIEGRVYFIINKFPIDSGIRIPPGEVYHIHLNEWENLAKVSDKAVLCYLPAKKESLKTEESESQTD